MLLAAFRGPFFHLKWRGGGGHTLHVTGTCTLRWGEGGADKNLQNEAPRNVEEWGSGAWRGGSSGGLPRRGGACKLPPASVAWRVVVPYCHQHRGAAIQRRGGPPVTSMEV